MTAKKVETVLPRPWPQHAVRQGRLINLEPLDAAKHVGDLFEAGHGSQAGVRIWDYLPYGPFTDAQGFEAWLRQMTAAPDPQFYTIVDKVDMQAVGICSFLRIQPAHGVIEIGHIWFAPRLQRTAGATEAMFLLFRHVFEELGYRRLEWKCNALNKASRRAAERLGFQAEGIFRQHLVVKGSNRDSAWFSMLDHEWPMIGSAMRAWLDPSNVAGGRDGRQLRPLQSFIDEAKLAEPHELAEPSHD